MSALSGKPLAGEPASAGVMPEQQHRQSIARLGRRFGAAILRIFVGLLALLSLLPVAFLPFVTAVPPVIYLPLALVDAALFVYLFTRANTMPERSAAIAGLVIISFLAVLLSQRFATTPPITGVDGQPLPGSVAELTPVELNGTQQWITIRGHDTEKPVLLFLAGGPAYQHHTIYESFRQLAIEMPVACAGVKEIPFAHR